MTILHDTTRNRFYTVIENNECFVDYAQTTTTPPVIDILRTFVHPDLRGRGIAESLLKSACEHAAQNGYAIRPSCSYAVLYFQRHPDQASLLAKDVDPENGGSCRLR